MVDLSLDEVVLFPIMPSVPDGALHRVQGLGLARQLAAGLSALARHGRQQQEQHDAEATPQCGFPRPPMRRPEIERLASGAHRTFRPGKAGG
jgi:hypothetical protein